ncbi:AGAP010659-PA, partial [Anopheles gambiae str. PEST]
QSKAGFLRIVNGKNANIASYPYIVRLRVNSAGVCGASIITYTHVFTAAHCLYKNQNPASITLYGGSTSQTSGGVVFFASKVIIHPYYNPETHNYDAGIVQIKNSFQGYKNIAPIALQDVEVPSDTTCYAAGWGYNNYDRKTSPDNLQYATLQVISPQQCSAGWSSYATPQFICAQQNNNGDVCNGDSGGPFVCNDKLTGATSYGGVACRGKLPSAFTKITLYGGSASQTSGGIVFFACKVIIHPQYDPETQDYDAGIVQIKKSFHGYKNIAPNALQNAEVPSNTSCYVIGWGLTNYDVKITPDIMQYAILKVISPLQCSVAWSSYATPQFICAKHTVNEDVCNGDSGGPFVCNGKLTGATSYSGQGCRSKMPSAFVKVTAPAIREFIRTNVGI